MNNNKLKEKGTSFIKVNGDLESLNYDLILGIIYQNQIMRKLVLFILIVLSFTGVVSAQKNELVLNWAIP